MILVTGATTMQGKSAVLALLRNNKFKVQLLTEHPDAPQLAELRRAGAEIIAANLKDNTSITSALKDVYGVFAASTFEATEEESLEQKRLIDAISRSSVKHFILSSQPSYAKLSNGVFHVRRFDTKAELEGYTRQLQLPFSFVRMAFNYEHIIELFPLEQDRRGNLHFGFPQGDTKLAMASVSDLGPIVAKIFEHPVEYIGRTVGVVAEDRPCHEYAYIMSKVMQRNVYYTHVPHEDYAASAIRDAKELADMFEVQRRYVPGRQLDLIESHGLNPSMLSLEKWLIDNRERLLAAVKPQESVVY